MITGLQAHMLLLAALATLSATVHAGPQQAPDGKRKLGPALEKLCDILIVDGEPADKKERSESFYLKIVFGAHAKVGAPLSVTVVNHHLPSRFTSKLVVLANVDDVGPKAAAILENHVKRGGGLLVFCGDRVNIARYNALLYKEGKAVLPGTLKKKIVAEKDKADRPLRLDPATWRIGDHNPFAGEMRHFLQQAVVTGHVSVTPDRRAKTELKYDNGDPAVLSKRFGKGRSVLVTTACDMEWSNLPSTTAYVVFIGEVLRSFEIGEERQPGANMREK